MSLINELQARKASLAKVGTPEAESRTRGEALICANSEDYWRLMNEALFENWYIIA